MTEYAYNATHIARSCLAKRYYHSRKDARYAKRLMAQKKGCVFTIYRCRHCDGFHLTHQQRRGNR
jgi:hypothetical protein